MTGIIFYIYKIIKFYSKDKKYTELIPILLVILYNLIDMAYLRHGIYWASASVLYIWPLLPFFAVLYLYITTCKKIKDNKKFNYSITILILIILSFFTTFSQEQIGVGLLAFQFTYIILNHFKCVKKYLKIEIPFFITTFVSYIVLFMAPGNWKRMDTNTDFSELSIFGKIMRNYPNIMKDIFMDKMNIFIFLLCIFLLYVIYIIYKNYKNKKVKYVFVPISLIVNIVLIFVFTFKSTWLSRNIIVCPLGTVWLVILFFCSLFYFNINKKMDFCSILVCGFFTIICLLMSPVTGGRTFLPFIFFVILLDCKLILDILNDDKKIKIVMILILIFISKKAIFNYIQIYHGYRENYSIYKLNDEKLRNYKKVSNNKTIDLYKIENSWYGSTQSYEEPSMDFWIKEYYNIPQDYNFNWIDLYEQLR